MAPAGRRCNACGKRKARSSFHARHKSPGGLQSECKVCRRLSAARRYQAKREHINATTAQYRKKNPKKVAAFKRRYYEAHKKEYARDLRLWRKKNWAYHYINHQLPRRSKARGARSVAFTHGEWLEIMAEYGFMCAYCHSTSKLTVDHIVPLSKGGAHIRANIAPACQPCNSRKSNS